LNISFNPSILSAGANGSFAQWEPNRLLETRNLLAIELPLDVVIASIFVMHE
jgi:hypothetical protein